MSTTNSNKNRLIHVGRYRLSRGGVHYVYLREVNPHHYVWYDTQTDGTEVETSLSAPHSEEAIRLAQKQWRDKSFRTVNCGFRYTLPERDEHGMNALFHHMGASYETSDGVYFDEDLGHNCFVQNASEEARDLWRKLKAMDKT